MSSADSHGRSTSDDNIVLIFDLDKTILSVNSFPYWAFYMLVGKFSRLTKTERIAITCSTWLALLRGKLLHQQHMAVKHHLQQLWAQALAKDPDKEALTCFLRQLHTKIRPNMKEVLAYVAVGKLTAIMATAAAAEYAVPFGKALGFSYVIATAYTESGVSENKGVQKRDNVLAYIRQNNWQNKKRLFFTDHEDDLPLMQQSDVVLWFGEKNIMHRLQLSAPKVTFILCLHMDGKQLLALAKGEIAIGENAL